MRHVEGFNLWIGTARDARDLRAVLDAEIEAIVDLAMEEPPVQPTREILYLRFPLVDGEGNGEKLLRVVVGVLMDLLRESIPTLVSCSAGMSRSPSVVATALARFNYTGPPDELEKLKALGPCDVSPGLWHDLMTHYVWNS